MGVQCTRGHRGFKEMGKKRDSADISSFSGETGCCLSKLKNILRKMFTETTSIKEKLTMKQRVKFNF
jgi:hypothetical protein